MTYKGGKLDWLGIDDGTRAMPKGIPATKFDKESGIGVELAKNNVSDWTTSLQELKPNMSFQYSFGRNKEIKNSKLGVIGALNYNNTNVFNNMVENKFGNLSTLELNERFNYENTINQTLLGALFNISIKLKENHQLSLKNIYSINSDDRLIIKTGRNLAGNNDSTQTVVRWFTSNRILSNQLIGNHYFPVTKIRLNWIASYGNVNRVIPNLRTNIFKILEKEEIIANSETISEIWSGNIFNSTNDEVITSIKTDVSYPFQIGSLLKNEIKSGIFLQNRERIFSARPLQYILPQDFNDLNKINYQELYTKKYMGEKGLYLADGFDPKNNYSAKSVLNAGYLQLDQRLKNLRLIWGARIENYNQKLKANKDSKPLDIDYPDVLDILPSSNLIYSINEKQNVRFSYSKTINRPEFRELAPFLFYDFNIGMSTNGNDTLVRSRIDNLDFRYEIYPGKGQMFSFSLFNKNFENPIEPTIYGNDVTIVYRNAKKAQNFGAEIEFRTNLGSIFSLDSSAFLNNFNVFSNLAIVRSKIEIDSTVRPLQGQSPYVFNAGLSYVNTKHAYSLSLNINKIGERIYIVGIANPEGGILIPQHIWENSRTFLDLQITKKLFKNKLDLKLNIQNILAQDQVFYHNTIKNERSGNESLNTVLYGNKDNLDGYNSEKDANVWKTNFGRIFSFSATYNF
jgi:hypothetical protein